MKCVNVHAFIGSKNAGFEMGASFCRKYQALIDNAVTDNAKKLTKINRKNQA